jgi:hypothetical protein
VAGMKPGFRRLLCWLLRKRPAFILPIPSVKQGQDYHSTVEMKGVRPYR